MSDTTVSRELHLCHRHYGWSLQTIKEIIIAGWKSAFMPYRRRPTWSPPISRELAGFSDPRGEVAGRVGLVESDPMPPAPSPANRGSRPKVQLSEAGEAS